MDRKLANRRVVFFSNGHGEDLMAARIIEELTKAGPEVDISAWPMVGQGKAYQALGVPVLGPPNLLPSLGFALFEWRLLLRDLAAGWVGTHWAQVRAAVRLHGRFDLAVAVGDVVPMLAACLAGLPFLFVGCAKSAYYDFSYTRFEKSLLRRFCTLSFPRDEITAREMEKAGIRQRYVGIPCMDGLSPSGQGFGLEKDALILGLLPGSRQAMEQNAETLLAVTAKVLEYTARKVKITGLMAVTENFDEALLSSRVLNGGFIQGWRLENSMPADPDLGVVLRLAHVSGASALIVKGRLGDVLPCSTVVVGLAGTANEQAVGMGKPLVTFPDKGVFGKNYVNMKMQFFGASAIATRPRPRDAARAVAALLDDPGRRERMGAVGRERMGGPGASRAIALEIVKVLDGF